MASGEETVPDNAFCNVTNPPAAGTKSNGEGEMSISFLLAREEILTRAARSERTRYSPPRKSALCENLSAGLRSRERPSPSDAAPRDVRCGFGKECGPSVAILPSSIPSFPGGYRQSHRQILGRSPAIPKQAGMKKPLRRKNTPTLPSTPVSTRTLLMTRALFLCGHRTCSRDLQGEDPCRQEAGADP